MDFGKGRDGGQVASGQDWPGDRHQGRQADFRFQCMGKDPIDLTKALDATKSPKLITLPVERNNRLCRHL